MMLSPVKIGGRLKRSIGRKLISFLRDLEYRSNSSNFPTDSSLAPNCVIGNAVPKSGTYLLNSIVSYLGHWKNTNVHFLDGHFFVFQENRDSLSVKIGTPRSITLLKPGQFAAAHLHWSKGLRDVLAAQRSIRHVFMFRDPRDTFVSYMRFFTNSKTCRHWAPSRIEQDFVRDFLSNDDDRLTYSIMHIIKRERWDLYLPWLNDPNTYAMKFEDLYPEVLNTANGVFGPCLSKLIEHLGCLPENLSPVEFYGGVLGSGKTNSGEHNKIGQYKRYFTDRHFKMLDNPMFRDVLDKFGYKWD